MKKLIVLACLIIGTSSFAQQKTQQTEKLQVEKLSAQQRTNLAVKKMTLDLDLNAAQQSQMASIMADKEAKRATKMAAIKTKKEAGLKLTAQERYDAQSEMLDNQIATKAAVKKVLTAEQFFKWETMQQKKQDKMKKKAKAQTIKK